MSHFLDDILAEPAALRGSLQYSAGAGLAELMRAAALVRGAGMIYITGIGSSWHAGMAVQSLFDRAARPAMLVDASELLHNVQFAAGGCLVALSRSGKSVEIVKLLDKAQAAGTKVIAVTNTPDSPLGRRAEVVLPLQARFDHNVSVTMYSALTLVGGLLAAAALGEDIPGLAPLLDRALAGADGMLQTWRTAIGNSGWLAGEKPTYFLARGGSMASCSEARLLWEEAAKTGATAMTTGGFRHGPQEILVRGARIGLWLSPGVLRDEDLQLIADLRSKGAPTLLIGQRAPAGAADLVLPLPEMAGPLAAWQFLIDVIPAQLASAQFARQRGMDSDEFALCPYVIEAEGGLVGAAAGEGEPKR